ncbi:MAG TPA: hypothetical protein VGB77_20290 [Abditibacteriaceae bacterium]
MKKENRLIFLSCVVAFVLLWGVTACHTVTPSRMKNTTTSKPMIKPTLQPYNLSMDRITATKRHGRVEVDFPFSGPDPPFPMLRVLVTVLQRNKTSNVFVLNSSIAALSAQSHSQWTYNRKQRTLVIQSTTSMAGMEKTEEPKTICRKISENLLLNLVTKKPEATLLDLGGACTIIEPTKKQPKNS